MTHYLKALDIQRDLAKIQAIFGGKNPHPQSIVVGGVTCVQDIMNPARISLFQQLLRDGREFIKGAYLPDVYMAGTMYAKEATDSEATYTATKGTGEGILNYLSYGDFKLDDTGFYHAKDLFPSGIVMGGDVSKVIEVNYVVDYRMGCISYLLSSVENHLLGRGRYIYRFWWREVYPNRERGVVESEKYSSNWNRKYYVS